MKTMGWSLSALAMAVLLGATAAAAPAGTAAQQRAPRSERSDCKCVDNNGKEIPNCTCLRTMGPGSLAVGVFGRPASRVRLGISVSTGQAAADDAKGARVQSVMDGGPAEEAGIRKDDIITKVDGKSLFEPLDPDVEKGFDLDASVPVQRLLAIAGKLDPDTRVQVEYLRDGKAHTATVTTRDLDGWSTLSIQRPGIVMRGPMNELREKLDSLTGGDRLRWMVIPDESRRLRLFTDSAGHPDFFLRSPGGGTLHLWGPDSASARSWRCPGQSDSGLSVFNSGDECIGGLRLIQLNPGLASYFSTDKGVLVSDVDASSATGLQPGDVILQIGGRDAVSPDKARRILDSYSADEEIDFHIVRKGKTMDVRGRLGG